MPAAGTKRKYDWAEAKVNGVPVVKSNVHIGKAVVHGIGSVLSPNAPAVTTEKAPAAAAAPKSTNGRRMLAFGWGMMAGPTAAQDDVSGQIEAAVNGDESAAAAARSSTLRKFLFHNDCCCFSLLLD